jgi:hypothetical protein
VVWWFDGVGGAGVGVEGCGLEDVGARDESHGGEAMVVRSLLLCSVFDSSAGQFCGRWSWFQLLANWVWKPCGEMRRG